MITGPMRRHGWRLPRLLLEDQLALAGLSWVGLLIATIAIVTGVSFRRDIVLSGWDIATGIVPWYAAFIAGYVMHTLLPLHIAHGRTRRDFATEAAIFGAIFTTVLALLATLGFAIEQGAYAIAGWSREAPDDHLFTSYTDYATIFAEYWLAVLVWTVTGGFVGAALYRSRDIGWFALVPAAALIGLSSVAGKPRFGPLIFVADRFDLGEVQSVPIAFVVSVGCALVALVMTWPIVRDMPMRNR